MLSIRGAYKLDPKRIYYTHAMQKHVSYNCARRHLQRQPI